MFHEDWYSNDQCKVLENVCKYIPEGDGLICEIGCWEGKSTGYIANAIYPQVVVCNDTWEGNVDESIVTGQEHVSVDICKTRDVFSTFKNNMNILTKGNYEIVKMDCFDWLQKNQKPIRFAHIDASHDYISVKKAIEYILPNLVRGGILCGDDFQTANMSRSDLQGGVERAVRELLPGVQNIENFWYWVK